MAEGKQEKQRQLRTSVYSAPDRASLSVAAEVVLAAMKGLITCFLDAVVQRSSSDRWLLHSREVGANSQKDSPVHLLTKMVIFSAGVPGASWMTSARLFGHPRHP